MQRAQIDCDEFTKGHKYLKCNHYFLNKTHTGLDAVYFFLRSCEHFGQNHFPFGFVVKPTQAKWNHSIGHWNRVGERNFVNVFFSSNKMEFKWVFAYLCVITSDHFTVWNLLTNTVCGLIWINGHIQYVTWMRCCMASLFCFRFFRLCYFLHTDVLRLQKRNILIIDIKCRR